MPGHPRLTARPGMTSCPTGQLQCKRRILSTRPITWDGAGQDAPFVHERVRPAGHRVGTARHDGK
ncbi:hypothetical protein LU298_13445 [Komagataeibacter intermedius]|uniref:Uncharacterized protein n=1 Tax=Komagataeibacter intermedius AF2 TaxID=1458464 RepID=A0A0N0MEN0_9PROT|nr:hypothetical protein [Komagataeibacter intermedius]KPH85774.1 hypothetical protein GLUCOINTEAF2_0201029 [Komagataeibacter intermedius AF2]MCF3637494.1 hypothetical protein [Komagataeibacter intermedius]